MTETYSSTPPRPSQTIALKLISYKIWASNLIFAALDELPDEELVKERPTTFKSILGTLNHVYVVDDIFKHHLCGLNHGYQERKTNDVPTLSALRTKQSEMDNWYLKFAESLSSTDAQTPIDVPFISGTRQIMTKQDILLHIVDHATYHRGYVADMMYQIPLIPPTTDFPVFLREK